VCSSDLGTVWAVLTHPGSEVAGWLPCFEEFCRWISPIGMMPRRIAQPWTVRGVDLEPETRAFFLIGSGNRDPNVFPEPDQFDPTRDHSKSIAFGAGPHYCVGTWASRAMVADVALPSLFRRLGDLRLVPEAPTEFRGWAFRGPTGLMARWG